MSLNKCQNCGCEDALVTPAPCPTPGGCPDPEPCSEVFNAECVIYTGDVLTPGITVQDAINDLATPAYRVFTAIISQSGTSNPTVVAVLQNTIGTITITRNAQGVYYFESPSFNSFSSNNKVFVSVTNGQSTTGLYASQYVPPISTVQIITFNTSNTATDGLLSNACLEIRLYN